MSKRIKILLNDGQAAIIDASDHHLVKPFTWTTHRRNNICYARAWLGRKNGKRQSVYMHRLIMRPRRNQLIDHRNTNGLHNWRKNMRACTRSQNGMNSRSVSITKSSRYKGVSLHQASKKWKANITLNGEHHYLGLFTGQRAAAMAYDKAALRLHGEFARLNFGDAHA